jgi:hypothetical protein
MATWLTRTGLGAHLRKAADSREIAQRPEELYKQRFRSGTTDQWLFALDIYTTSCRSAH